MLRKYRRAYGYQQQRFADKAHISPGYLCDLEHGLKKPSAGLAKVIADVFGVKVTAVFPDGVAEKDCRQKFAPPAPYGPDDPGPRRLYPRRPFTVLCWHCKARVPMCADDYRPVVDAEPRCPSCGAEFREIMPLEEMRP